ncbi:hypothetical protein GJW-30_1_00273 [Variibacter gotjawalensis]|uniref:PilZ domain-containing protein n=1 Tax=Variibacter gotjawalensis TaxID=1333996 RepID=A0A0S3PPF7_9BRAD|nr:hypothetical protein [Variibacter gotjawalensis]NIK48060.1 hypothetical protein [Variibacter gotjawalensis]RZS49936.1 hypothetical protein EV661_2384 [Variibacter gotjawalensis]BAT57763.1 hypothetical protein GJW-30_1_00273 [Variibacter gotjawalensis]
MNMFTRKKDKAPPLVAVNHAGSLSVPGEFATVPCNVLRMSATAAELRLDRPRQLPSAFRLTIRGEARSRSCQLVSAERRSVQVRFA